MKGSDWHALLCGAGGTKKSLHTAQDKDGFFVSGAALSFSPFPFMFCYADAPVAQLCRIHSSIGTSAVKTAIASPFPNSVLSTFSHAVAVFLSAYLLSIGGRSLNQSTSHSYRLGDVLFFRLRHFIKEYIVTITNHIRNIEDLAPQVIEFVDARQYSLAHCALDEIEKEVRRSHRHIEHLQNVSEFCPIPKEDIQT